MTEEVTDRKHTHIGFEITYDIEELLLLHAQLSQYKDMLMSGRINQTMLSFLQGHYEQISRILETGLKTGWWRGYELTEHDKNMIIRYLINVK